MSDLEIKAASISVDDAGTITGIAWPYNAGPDSVGDIILPGAFSMSAALPIFHEHSPDKVIGTWESATETERGLEVKGRLYIDSVPRAREAHTELRAGRINGLSIGFRVREFKARPGGGREIAALHVAEVSITKTPSHPAARINEVKSAAGGAASPILESPMENEAVETKAADPVVTAEEMNAMRARLDKIEAKSNRPVAANNNHPAAVNDNGDLETKAYAEYLRKGDQMALETKAALTVANESQAGYLAPETHGGEVVKLLREYSPIRQYARVITVGGSSIKYPRRTGSTEAFWTAESAERTASDMAFEQIGITPHELATYVDVSRALAEDNAYDLAGELNSDLAESFAIAEGRAFISGTGNGQPKGLIHPDNLVDFQKIEATIGTATADADVIIDMYHAIPQVFAERGIWLMNRKTLGALRKVKNANGDYILVADMTTGMKSTILGRPVIVMPDMPDLEEGEAGAILFGDLQGYRVTDRVSFAMLVDPYSRATHGEIRYHARRRVGADVTHPDRFAFFKAA